MRNTGHGWQHTLTPGQKRRCLAAMGFDTERTVPRGGGSGWFIRLDRSIGTPQGIELCWKDDLGRVCRVIPIDATPD